MRGTIATRKRFDLKFSCILGFSRLCSSRGGGPWCPTFAPGQLENLILSLFKSYARQPGFHSYNKGQKC